MRSHKIARRSSKKCCGDFMTEHIAALLQRHSGPQNSTQGQLSVTKDIGQRDYIRFYANLFRAASLMLSLNFKQGKYSVVLHENFTNRKVLLSVWRSHQRKMR
jgi:hypothetical protein